MLEGYTIEIDPSDSLYTGDSSIYVENSISSLLYEIGILWYYYPNIKIVVYNHFTGKYIPKDKLDPFLLGHAKKLEKMSLIILSNLDRR